MFQWWVQKYSITWVRCLFSTTVTKQQSIAMVTSLKWALVLKNANFSIASKLAAVCSVFILTLSIKYLIKISRKEENICCINTVLMHQHPSEVLMADWNQLPWMIGTSNNNYLFYSSISWFCPIYPLKILSVTETRQNITCSAPLQVNTH